MSPPIWGAAYVVFGLCISVAVFSAGAANAAPEVNSAGPKGLQIATFAGGCFWCVESDFDKVPGVERTVSGYTGGRVANPSYSEVSSETTGHREAVQIHFDAAQTTFANLLDIFWRSVDPTDDGGQFCDRGESYTTAIFVASEEQRRLAETSKRALEKSEVLKQPIATKIETAGVFYPAEDYHQNYYEKNPVRYWLYRKSCRRDARVKELWGDEAYRGIAPK